MTAWRLALLLAVGTAAYAAENIRIVETRPLPVAAVQAKPGPSHELRLTAYTFLGTRWARVDLAPAVIEVAALFRQCGIALERAELHVVEAPRRYHFYSTPVSRELARQLPVAKPAVFFVEDTRNVPAFDAEAIGRGNAATRPELADTVWVAWGARDLPLALAHELVHVLADSGEHSDEPGNLMREETSPENTRLTPAQCERLRARGEANGLLRISAPR
jgi:hypothetical protein